MVAHEIFFECEGVADRSETAVLTANGRYALSRPYEVTLTLSCRTTGGWPTETIEQLLTRPCKVSFEPVAHEIHGVLRSIRLLPILDPARPTYEAILVPALDRLTLDRGSRIFQDETWPAIVHDILDRHAIRHELRLNAQYPTREYTVQYEESDFDFISRLLEHHGIFYFFEQTPDGELLVIADGNDAFQALEGREQIDYTIQGNALWESFETASVTHLDQTIEVRPATVQLKDYNWRTPAVAIEGSADADATTGVGEVQAYADHVKDPTEAATLAQIRAEELMATRERFTGRTSEMRLQPGHRFLLVGYPSPDLDIDYVITEVADAFVTAAAEGGGASAQRSFTAIRVTVPYRPPRVTRKPRVDGFIHAIVDGEVPGMAAPLDTLGRYKLRFAFDRADAGAARASRWVRMAQSSTGADYGMHLPLHIGCEVAVLHLAGDPDRPVILGAIPNAETTSPVTRDDATKSRIRTKAGILIELEDSGP
ncbi:MAG: type VI secretion system Vgr family protein [Sandaracinaceae bacterium]